MYYTMYYTVIKQQSKEDILIPATAEGSIILMQLKEFGVSLGDLIHEFILRSFTVRKALKRPRSPRTT